MPKSKNRKKHKQKVQQYQQRIQENRSKINKMNRQMQAQMMEYYQQHYKDYVLEVAYKENPSFLIKQDNAYLINDEKASFVDNVLVWKETGEPVLGSVSLQTSNAGERSTVDASEYTEEVVYDILKRMFDRHQNQPDISVSTETQDFVEAEVVIPEVVTSGYSAPDWSTLTPVSEVKEVEHTAE